MARPRKHASEEEQRQAHAQSQRAYRQRQAGTPARADDAALAELVAAIEDAAAAGDGVARRAHATRDDDLLRNLARLFRERAARARLFRGSGKSL